MKIFEISPDSDVSTFDLVQNGNKYILKYAKNERWSKQAQGKIAVSIDDDQNGQFTIKLKNKEFKLDICELSYLRILLECHDKFDGCLELGELLAGLPFKDGCDE